MKAMKAVQAMKTKTMKAMRAYVVNAIPLVFWTISDMCRLQRVGGCKDAARRLPWSKNCKRKPAKAAWEQKVQVDVLEARQPQRLTHFW